MACFIFLNTVWSSLVYQIRCFFFCLLHIYMLWLCGYHFWYMIDCDLSIEYLNNCILFLIRYSSNWCHVKHMYRELCKEANFVTIIWFSSHWSKIKRGGRRIASHMLFCGVFFLSFSQETGFSHFLDSIKIALRGSNSVLPFLVKDEIRASFYLYNQNLS